MKGVVLVLLFAGCIIPGVDEDDKACPCASGYVCDDSSQRCVRGPLDASAAADLAPELDGGTLVTIAGETIVLAAGWQASLYTDFSSKYGYEYDPGDFDDTTNMETDDNAPRRIVTLVPPFTDGIAILAGRSIIDVPTSGGGKLYSYKPTAPNAGNYPDIPRDLYFARTVGSTPAHLLVAGNSAGNGDGIFTVDVSFVMTTLMASNNNSTVVFDATGLFDAQPAGQTYFTTFGTSTPHLERLSDGATILPNTGPYPDDAEVLPDGTMALAIDESGGNGDSEGLALVTAKGTVFTMSVLDLPPSSTGLSLVTGDLTRLSGLIYANVGAASLVRLSATSDPQTVAASTTAGWTWVAAAVPPVEHSAGATPVFLVLESNRAQNIDRVLELTPP